LQKGYLILKVTLLQVNVFSFMTKSHKLNLHDFHREKSARFTEFAGWEMPVSYGSSVEEHLHTRLHCSLFDVSHMGEIIVHGPDASKFLDFILTNSVSNVKPGKAIYSPFCYENGATVDDLIAYKKSDEEYFLCVNASNILKDFQHFSQYVARFDCTIENVSNAFGQIALQGPASVKVLSDIVDKDLSKMPKMSFLSSTFNLGEALIARTGYTGEDGFEIYCNINDSILWANSFNEYEAKKEVQWAGLGARDSLRLEAGFPLYGHEISDSISPLQAGLSWAIKWNKEFVGKSSLLAEREKGVVGKVCFYEAEDRKIPRDDAVVYCNGKEVGRVLSGGYSPLLKKPIGSAWVESQFLGDEDASIWETRVRQKIVSIKLSSPVMKKKISP
jgi:aminomethyltransferase